VEGRRRGRRIRGIVVRVNETPFSPLLRTQSDVEELWRRLMSPLGFSSPSLWLVVIEDERPWPRIMEFSDLPASPSDEVAAGMVRALENLAAPNICCAFLRTRPGHGRPDADDLAWAETLYRAGRSASVRLAVVHLAHDHDVLPLALDDLRAEPA
jgi:hypothetical protein